MSKFSKIFLHLGWVTSLVMICVLFYSSSEKKNYDYTSTQFVTGSNGEPHTLPQVVKSPKIRSDVQFAGEIIPINVDTRERLDRELLVNSYYHSSTIIALKNAARYFPVIDQILAEEGVPLDFKYLAVAESNLSNVISSAGAKGFWQFMSGASKDYGLDVNSEIDERYHLEKSTKAAARYLKSLKNKFGSWINAAAAYNMGQGNMSKFMNEQGQDSFFDMSLNSETSRYVFRLVAIKEIMENPSGFGYYIDNDDIYEPWSYYEVEVTKSIPNLGAFARENGISYRLLKYYNPWLMDNKLTFNGSNYSIKIPRTK